MQTQIRPPQQWKSNKPKKKFSLKFLKNYSKWELIRIIILIGLICFVLGSIVLVGIFAKYSREVTDSPEKLIDRFVPESTKIYDRAGETLLREIRGEDDQSRTIVELDQISDFIKWATIAAEDKNFYEHRGFSITGMFRALINNVLNLKFSQGGSTITQQLIKKAILSDEKKLERKFKELVLAYQIEKKYKKDQILQLYLNEIPYGHPYYGIEAAAQGYFAKSSKDVSLAEAALLAALPQDPEVLKPFGGDSEQLKQRKEYVLNQMVDAGFISQSEADTAKKQEIKYREIEGNILAPHFVFYVQKLLAKELNPDVYKKGGLKVTTTLDYDKQKYAEEAIKNNEELHQEYNATNTAMLSIDAKTGQILAYIGSRDYNNNEIDGQFDVVSMGLRQPGSSFKPVVYAKLFEKGYTTATVLYDVVTEFSAGGKSYKPLNYNLEEYGAITARKALAGSLNISAVKALYLAGVGNVIELAQRMGYTTLKDPDIYGLSLVLGGGEIYLLDHVGAYDTFARDGERHEVASVLKVEDKNGKTLYEYKDVKKKVIDSEVVRNINNILSDNASRTFAFGANNHLTLPDRPVCAKTGTTNDYADAWLIGYTPSIVTGVWVGNKESTNTMKQGGYGSTLAGPIWQEYMTKATAGTPVETFKEPKEIPEDLAPYLRGVTDQIEVVVDKASGKLATELTPEIYQETKKFSLSHSILHFIDKNNPLGGPPEDPNADPQYALWEKAILEWAEEQEDLELELPPTEEDDLHVEENTPSIRIISPTSNQSIDIMPLQVMIEASAPRGIRRAEYYLDDELIGTVFQSPFNLNSDVVGFKKGFYQLKAVAFDDIDNSKSEEVTINLKAESKNPQLKWLTPRQNASFYSSSFPLTLSVELNSTRDLKEINFYYSNLSDLTLITKIPQVTQQKFNINWLNPPGSGDYQIIAELITIEGTSYQSIPLNLNIKE